METPEQQTHAGETSADISDLATALAKAQSQIEGASKDKTNPHYKSRYADLASIWHACRDALTANGIGVVQMTRYAEKDEVIVVTRLVHSSGQWMRGELNLPVSRADAQGFGSALTYARRYALAAAVGVSPEDDDGQAAAAAKPDYSMRLVERGKAKPITATQEAHDTFASMSQEQQQFLREQAMEIMDRFDRKEECYAWVEAQNFDNDEKLALWSLLPSNVRSTIKKQREQSQLATQP